MKTLIIEDEQFSAQRLKGLLTKIDASIEVLTIIPSVKQCLAWFDQNEAPDLIFMDIHLEDQNSFRLFEELDLLTPIIYTTAYDQYALKAFKQNSIDYLMKPIDREELASAISKYKTLYPKESSEKKDRFLIKRGEELIPIPISEIAYFLSENKLSFLHTLDNKRFVVDYTLEQLTALLAPEQFYRINRSRIIALSSVKKIKTRLNGRLKIELVVEEKEDLFVSRDRVNGFKKWMGK